MNNILLIDDNLYIVEALALRIGMSLKNYNILTARNGKEATEILDSVPVGFIMTDLQMPIMDGYGVIEYKNKNHPHIPLFVMTGDTTPEVRKRLNDLGVSQWIEKPFDYEEVTRKILDELDAVPKVATMFADAVH